MSTPDLMAALKSSLERAAANRTPVRACRMAGGTECDLCGLAPVVCHADRMAEIRTDDPEFADWLEGKPVPGTRESAEALEGQPRDGRADLRVFGRDVGGEEE